MCYFLADLMTGFDSRWFLWELLHVSEPDTPFQEAFVSQADWRKFHSVVLAHCLHHTQEFVCNKGVNSLTNLQKLSMCIWLSPAICISAQHPPSFLLNQLWYYILLLVHNCLMFFEDVVLKMSTSLYSELPSVVFPFLKYEQKCWYWELESNMGT